ncbi:hypothetical protein, partial [Moraxella lacunata]|uniref:hypothetical protein n=2 Tax=Moraxellaceae TaxID=468 RepID=UPI0012DCAB5F
MISVVNRLLRQRNLTYEPPAKKSNMLKSITSLALKSFIYTIILTNKHQKHNLEFFIMTNETFGRICFAVALLLIGSRTLGDYVIFPYIAVTKAEKGEFKEACAYVVDKKKTTRSAEQFVIKLENNNFKEFDILPKIGAVFFNEDKKGDLPIRTKYHSFMIVEPNTCKKVQYVEVYNIFGFKKFYLYDYL